MTERDMKPMRGMLIGGLLGMVFWVTVALLASCVTAPPARAATYDWNLRPAPTPVTSRVIEIVDRVPGSSWPVGSAVAWLDRYTGSDMRLVKRCSGRAYSCITVRRGPVPGGAVARISNRVITIDTAKAAGGRYRPHYRKAATRRWLIAHELGHAFGLPHRGGRNLMNPTAGAGALMLSGAQKRHLKGR